MTFLEQSHVEGFLLGQSACLLWYYGPGAQLACVSFCALFYMSYHNHHQNSWSSFCLLWCSTLAFFVGSCLVTGAAFAYAVLLHIGLFLFFLSCALDLSLRLLQPLETGMALQMERMLIAAVQVEMTILVPFGTSYLVGHKAAWFALTGIAIFNIIHFVSPIAKFYSAKQVPPNTGNTGSCIFTPNEGFSFMIFNLTVPAVCGGLLFHEYLFRSYDGFALASAMLYFPGLVVFFHSGTLAPWCHLFPTKNAFSIKLIVLLGLLAVCVISIFRFFVVPLNQFSLESAKYLQIFSTCILVYSVCLMLLVQAYPLCLPRHFTSSIFRVCYICGLVSAFILVQVPYVAYIFIMTDIYCFMMFVSVPKKPLLYALLFFKTLFLGQLVWEVYIPINQYGPNAITCGNRLVIMWIVLLYSLCCLASGARKIGKRSKLFAAFLFVSCSLVQLILNGRLVSIRNSFQNTEIRRYCGLVSMGSHCFSLFGAMYMLKKSIIHRFILVVVISGFCGHATTLFGHKSVDVMHSSTLVFSLLCPFYMYSSPCLNKNKVVFNRDRDENNSIEKPKMTRPKVVLHCFFAISTLVFARESVLRVLLQYIQPSLSLSQMDLFFFVVSMSCAFCTVMYVYFFPLHPDIMLRLVAVICFTTVMIKSVIQLMYYLNASISMILIFWICYSTLLFIFISVLVSVSNGCSTIVQSTFFGMGTLTGLLYNFVENELSLVSSFSITVFFNVFFVLVLFLIFPAYDYQHYFPILFSVLFSLFSVIYIVNEFQRVEEIDYTKSSAYTMSCMNAKLCMLYILCNIAICTLIKRKYGTSLRQFNNLEIRKNRTLLSTCNMSILSSFVIGTMLQIFYFRFSEWIWYCFTPALMLIQFDLTKKNKSSPEKHFAIVYCAVVSMLTLTELYSIFLDGIFTRTKFLIRTEIVNLSLPEDYKSSSIWLSDSVSGPIKSLIIMLINIPLHVYVAKSLLSVHVVGNHIKIWCFLPLNLVVFVSEISYPRYTVFTGVLAAVIPLTIARERKEYGRKLI